MWAGVYIMEKIQNLEGEVWLPVVGYEGFYEISNKGRLKTVKKTVRTKSNGRHPRKERILNPTINQKGYYHTSLHREASVKWFTIHRLVAQAFIPNPENKPQVNHIDSTPLNNNVENLEWCTHGENMKHGFLYGRKTQKGEKNNQAKITREIAEKVRELYAEGNLTQWQVGEVFGLARCHIKDITTYKIWK